MSNCLNYGNPEVPERMGEFVETLRGMGEVLRHLGIPAPSGNVSFYNETVDSYVPPTASLMGVGLMDDVSKAVTSDLKRARNRVYVVGRTRDQMAGSALYARHDAPHPHAPDVDPRTLSSSIEAMLAAANKGWLESCHDVSDGGLAVALAEMCIGGQLGADVDLAPMGRLRPVVKLFSESNTRWVVEVAASKGRHVEALFKRHGVPLVRVGTVTAAKAPRAKGKGAATEGAKVPRLRITIGKKVLVDLSVTDLEEAWNRTFWETMG
jgi:phosphoribosylformylglycinamidine synthase